MINAVQIVRDYMVNSGEIIGFPPVATDAIEEFSTYFDKESFEMQLLLMENSLIANSDDKVVVVQGLFRDMHSLKGSAGLLKIDVLVKLLHNLEDVLGTISNYAMSVESVKRTDIFDFFLQAFDLIERLVKIYRDNPHFILKDSREMFGFYARISVEARTIVENIDQYFEIGDLDEDAF